MKAFGHNVYIVASVTNQSGMGGIATYTKDRDLTADSEFGEHHNSLELFKPGLTETQEL